MSRCFPFPPPGYEKKPTIDDIDLLKKEKHKEKKHKKDKKDREKRERKEKKEKDRSEGKHKEKKDKKDKHRDKKKEKENGKDKEKGKGNTPDENRFEGPFEGHKLLQNNELDKHKNEISGNKKSPFQFQNEKEKPNREICSSSDDKRSSVLHRGQNGEFPFRNRTTVEENENSKFVQELGRRFRDEEKGTSSHQFVFENRKENVNRIELPKHTVVQSITNGNEKMGEKESEDRRKNKERAKEKDKVKEKMEEMKVKEKSEFKKAEGDKQKRIIKNSDSVASLNNLAACSPNDNVQHGGGELKKRKDMGTHVYSHENEPTPNKMARPTSDILTENGRKLGVFQNPSSNLQDKQGPFPAGFKVDIKERKVNGINVSQPSSVIAKKPPIPTSNHIPPRPMSTKSPPFITNHTSNPPLPVSSTKPTSVTPSRNLAHSLPVSAPKPLPDSKRKPILSTHEASKKPPHPDTKYLSQILTVPKLEQWCDFDDQDWLFSGKNEPHFNKSDRDDSLCDNKEIQVWSEAKHLESVDLCALPYVIPY